MRTFEFLAKEGMEDDYKIIRDKMAVGEIHYQDLNKYTQEMFGDEYFRGEEDIQDPRAIRKAIGRDFGSIFNKLFIKIFS